MATAAEKLDLFLDELDHWIEHGGTPAVPQNAVGRDVEIGWPIATGLVLAAALTVAAVAVFSRREL